jgi:hypothetical protein
MRECTYTTETDSGVTHTNVLGDLDEGVGHLGGVGAAGGRGDLLGHGDSLGADESGLAETLKERQNIVVSNQLSLSLMNETMMEAEDGSMFRWRCDEVTLRWWWFTREGALGDLGLDCAEGSRAGSHLGELGGDSGGHFEWFDVWKGMERRVVDEGWKIRVERSGRKLSLDGRRVRRGQGGKPWEPTQNFLVLPVRWPCDLALFASLEAKRRSLTEFKWVLLTPGSSTIGQFLSVHGPSASESWPMLGVSIQLTTALAAKEDRTMSFNFVQLSSRSIRQPGEVCVRSAIYKLISWKSDRSDGQW